MTEGRRFDKPFSLIMGDIDSFKQINDTYGHDMGDVALKSVTAIFRQSIGNDDVICRWGGEEFLLLINGDGARATFIAETVRKKVEENLIVFKGTELKFTMTLGVTYYKPGYDLDSLIKQADNNMYYGKRHGKNQVVSKELVY
jgi:diguanylate cyclase (GGDEF)-like protein